MEMYDLRSHNLDKTMVTPGRNVTAGLEELKGNGHMPPSLNIARPYPFTKYLSQG